MNRKYSLKKNHDIKELLQKKQSVGNKYYVIYYDYIEGKTPLIALSVSRKVGNAVERNYEKRVVREIIRPLLETIENYKMLIVIKDKSKELSYVEKEENINYLIKKMKTQKETINEKILNNKTVKMIGAIVLVLFVALVLTGCGCSGQPTEGGVPAPDPIIGFKSFWDLFVWPMAAIMWVVGKVMGGNYGLTIIFTTILVRTAAWPIYTKTNDMSLKTKLMAPDMEKLEAKYAGKDDKESQQRKQMEMMQLYKKYGIGIGGCLLPFLQMPLFLGFFQALRRIPDTLGAEYPLDFTFLKSNFLGLNLFASRTTAPEMATKIWILAIAVGVLQVLSQVLIIIRQKLQEKKVYSDVPEYRRPQQNQQNKSQNMMMNVFAIAMSVMMVVFVLNNPAGLGLYWLVGNIYTMIQAQISYMLTEKRLAKLKEKFNKE